MKKIPLTQNKFALVDNEDYEYINQWKWYHNGRYAARGKYYKKICGKPTSRIIFMHRIINKTPDDMRTDHINGEKLDNRKSNLRPCSNSENSMNKISQKNSSSKFKGVSRHRINKKWQTHIKINGKGKYLGCFTSEKQAAQAYNVAAKELFGEFAKLNIIEGLHKP